MYMAKRYFHALINRIKWLFPLLLMYILRIFPIKPNKLLFVNYFGKGYGDNAKYICQEIIHNKTLDIIWVVKDFGLSLPDNIRKVRYNSIRYFFDLATARVWIDNCRKDIFVRKRKGQFYIQTWHGDLAIKKIEKDAEKSLSPSYVKSAKNDSKMADLCICGNEWFEYIYRHAMWYNGKILSCGYPRRDVLYGNTELITNKVRKKYDIQESSHIVLYAPTFRRMQKIPNLDLYDIDWTSILNAFERSFGGKWVGFVRLHPNISEFSNKLHFNERVYDVTSYPDMQELLAVSDACISDYSSSILEFGVTGKPAFLFATDYEEYKRDRDVYFQLEELPFPLAQSNQELQNVIMSFSYDEYKKQQEFFYNDIIRMKESGNASKELANLIERICNLHF